jgi:hypothetical protein
MSKSKALQHPRVDVGADTLNIKALVERAQVVGQMCPLTALYANDTSFKTGVDLYVASGVALVAADAKVANLEAALQQARGDRDTSRLTCKRSYAVVASQVEKHSANAADLQAYGFTQLQIVKVGTAMPTAIAWTYDHPTGVLRLHVRFAGRVRDCLVEISPDPVGPATWHRLDGHGVKRTLTGYAPGTYWARAATSLADGRSDWFGPVSIVTK